MAQKKAVVHRIRNATTLKTALRVIALNDRITKVAIRRRREEIASLTQLHKEAVRTRTLVKDVLRSMGRRAAA